MKSNLYGYPWLQDEKRSKIALSSGVIVFCAILLGLVAAITSHVKINIIYLLILAFIPYLIEQTIDCLLMGYNKDKLNKIIKNNPFVIQDVLALIPTLKACDIPIWHYPSRMEKVINWLENITAEAIDIESPPLELYWTIEECSRGLKFIDSMLSRKDNTP